MSRHFTNLLLENIEEGLYDKDQIITKHERALKTTKHAKKQNKK